MRWRSGSPILLSIPNREAVMFYVALVALIIAVLSYVVVRLYVARNRQTHRANVNAERWHAAETMLTASIRQVDQLARDLSRAEIRLAEIREVITRRPPRRRWLRIAHRVAGLADVTQRAVRWPA